jgi:hypothetical protein
MGNTFGRKKHASQDPTQPKQKSLLSRVTDEIKSTLSSSQPQPQFGGLSINTYWKNLPPINDSVSVYWMYSGRNDKNSFYFMSASDSRKLEASFQNGDRSCQLEYGDNNLLFSKNNYVDFKSMKQVTGCGDDHRYVRRLDRNQYIELKKLYTETFQVGKSYWCLDCKTGYVLFFPSFQTIIDKAYRESSSVNITLNKCYNYNIDPYGGIQTNNITGKVRYIKSVLIGTNDKPVYGSFMTKFAAEAESMDESCIYPTSTDIAPVQPEEQEQAVMDESCIYPTSTDIAPVQPEEQEQAVMDESCIYAPVYVSQV